MHQNAPFRRSSTPQTMYFLDTGLNTGVANDESYVYMAEQETACKGQDKKEDLRIDGGPLRRSSFPFGRFEPTMIKPN